MEEVSDLAAIESAVGRSSKAGQTTRVTEFTHISCCSAYQLTVRTCGVTDCLGCVFVVWYRAVSDTHRAVVETGSNTFSTSVGTWVTGVISSISKIANRTGEETSSLIQK